MVTAINLPFKYKAKSTERQESPPEQRINILACSGETHVIEAEQRVFVAARLAEHIGRRPAVLR